MRLPPSIQAAMDKPAGRRFRSREWFADPHRSDMTALYLERFMNYGLTPEELRSGRPIVGIAQTGSDLSPCNRIHLELARRVRDGIRGDVLRIDLNQARCDAMVSADEIARTPARAAGAAGAAQPIAVGRAVPRPHRSAGRRRHAGPGPEAPPHRRTHAPPQPLTREEPE
jgi:dihydroxyacid dehydratase/phosphogluconate dehydratase